MKNMITFIALLLMLSLSNSVFAEPLEDRVKTLEETLRKQEQTIQELRALQETLKKQDQTIVEQRKLIDELKAEVQQAQPAVSPEKAAANQSEETGQIQQQVQELREKVDQVVEAQKKVLPSEFNPSIGLVGETIFSYRSKGSSKTGSDRPGGFDAFQRSVELNAAASVDPFAKAYVVVNASADAVYRRSDFGIEEAAIQTSRCRGI